MLSRYRPRRTTPTSLRAASSRRRPSRPHPSENREMTVTNGSRVWFVTGASRGIGRAIVEAAVARGDQVLAVVRSADAARSMTEAMTEASKPNALAAVADVTRPDEVRSAVD